MANKKRDEEELIIELRRENEGLQNRIAQLEKELKGYREREAIISDTMTAAIQYKKNAEAEAEKLVTSLTHNAEKQAQATIEAAENEAKQILEQARENAENYEAEAKKKCDELLGATEEKTKDILGIAKREADETNSYTDKINTALISAATELFKYITAYKDIYESVAGKRFGDLQTLPGIAAQNINTPESYTDPAQLYHVVMALDGRGGQPMANIPDSVPFSGDMLGIGDSNDAISSVLNLGQENNGDNSTAAHQNTSVSADMQEKADDTVTDSANVTEHQKVEEEAANSDESAELESMLTCFISDLESGIESNKAENDSEEKSAGNDNAAADRSENDTEQSQTEPAVEYTGGSVQPSDSESLHDVLASLFGDDDTDDSSVEG